MFFTFVDYFFRPEKLYYFGVVNIINLMHLITESESGSCCFVSACLSVKLSVSSLSLPSLQLALANFFEDGGDDDIATLPQPETGSVTRSTGPR